MDHPRFLALGFIVGSMALSAAFGIATLQCGMMSTAPGGEARCESHLHPIAPIGLALAGLGLFAMGRMPGATLGLGLLLTALGVAFGFSAGLYGIGAGLLLTLGGVSALCVKPAPQRQ